MLVCRFYQLVYPWSVMYHTASLEMDVNASDSNQAHDVRRRDARILRYDQLLLHLNVVTYQAIGGL